MGRGGEGRTLEKVGGLVGNQVAGKVLRRVHQTSDDGSAPVGAFPQVQQGRLAAHLLLDLDGALDHSQ